MGQGHPAASVVFDEACLNDTLAAILLGRVGALRRAPDDARVPVLSILILGFPGAGKTELMNALCSVANGSRRRAGVAPETSDGLQGTFSNNVVELTAYLQGPRLPFEIQLTDAVGLKDADTAADVERRIRHGPRKYHHVIVVRPRASFDGVDLRTARLMDAVRAQCRSSADGTIPELTFTVVVSQFDRDISRPKRSPVWLRYQDHHRWGMLRDLKLTLVGGEPHIALGWIGAGERDHPIVWRPSGGWSGEIDGRLIVLRHILLEATKAAASTYLRWNMAPQLAGEAECGKESGTGRTLAFGLACRVRSEGGDSELLMQSGTLRTVSETVVVN